MRTLHTVNLPDIGEGVVEGEVIRWLKNEGEAVTQDEPVVVVMTDKATVELPSPFPGILKKQHIQAGGTAIKNKPLYSLEVEATATAAKNLAPVEEKKEGASSTHIRAPASSHENILATPPTRHLAEELGIAIEEVSGTGKEGRITEEDVIAYHAGLHFQHSSINAPTKTPPLHLSDDEELPMIGRRHKIAEKMSETSHTVAAYSYFDAVDATRLIQLKNNIKKEAEKYGLYTTYMPFIIKALSKTIEAYPLINACVDMEHHQTLVHQHHDIGIAINHKDGLMVGVLRNVQEMSLHNVIRAYDGLMRRVQDETLTREEMVNSTITITNFGTLGGLWATPIINYPEIAILGISKIRKQAVVRDDAVVPREMMNLSWTFDHRAIDGDMAAKVSNKLIALLENPASLL